jgi:hypothetical protein
MKGKTKKASGGSTDPQGAFADDKPVTESYSGKSDVTKEAMERKRGGRAKRKDGGDCGVSGEMAKMRADRKPRKDGGRSPFSAAAAGTNPPGHKSYNS